MKKNRRNSYVPFILGLMMLSLTACRSAPEAEEGVQFRPNLEFAPPPVVRLAAGDQVDIKFYYTPELNELNQTVRPDGAITLQLINDYPIEGKTPAEASEELKELFAAHLVDPEVTVIVKSIANRKVYVGGEVLKPGIIRMPGHMMALEAIMEAGGFNPDTGVLSNVVLIRHENGKRYGCSLDFTDALKGKEYQPVFLKPNDILFVPETKITGVVRWIDKYIYRIIPINFALGHARGRTVTTVGFDPFRGFFR